MTIDNTTITATDPVIVATSPTTATFKPTATLIRSNLSNKETIGRLTAIYGSKTFVCDTLELPYLENQHDISCIPTGSYLCKLKPFHHTEMYELQDVPNRFAVFIHNGNYATGKPDTEGCILLGESYSDIDHNGQLDVLNSVDTVTKFHDFMGGVDFLLIIE